MVLDPSMGEGGYLDRRLKDEDRLEGMDCKAGQEDSKTKGKEALVRQARGLPKEAIEAAAAPCQEAQQEQAKPVPS